MLASSQIPLNVKSKTTVSDFFFFKAYPFEKETEFKKNAGV